jgi:coenzyme F420-0:L-glutamate ligase / coenzyme F420-1:gamma-L-glutamate ligase
MNMLSSGTAEIPALLLARRTVRFYRAEPVADEMVHALLEAAAAAPSAHNAQPTRYVVIRSPEAKQALAERMGRRWRRDLERSGTPEASIKVELRFSMRRFSKAPVLILAGYTMAEMDVYPDRARRAAEQTMAVQSAAAAVQNLLLAASANGLGACWCCAPLFCPGVVRRALDLARDFVPQALVTIGRPAHTPPVPPRKSLDAVVAYR